MTSQINAFSCQTLWKKVVQRNCRNFHFYHSCYSLNTGSIFHPATATIAVYREFEHWSQRKTALKSFVHYWQQKAPNIKSSNKKAVRLFVGDLFGLWLNLASWHTTNLRLARRSFRVVIHGTNLKSIPRILNFLNQEPRTKDP